MQKKVIKLSLKDLSIVFILLLAFVLRVFRIDELLGFWYDQGRDALVIWDMFHGIKFSLVGQMMGFTGILRGGWFYWLLTPFYALGRGNPVWPSVFLIATTVFAVYLLYKAGKEMSGTKLGVMAALIATVSFYIINASRWLSGTTPELLVSMLIVWTIFRFLDKKKWSVPLLGLLVGLSLQFEGAGEVFLIPAILLIFYLNRKILPNIKTFALAFTLFLLPAVPQVFFEIRHPGVLSGAIYNFLFHEKSFTLSFWEILRTRLPYYYNLIYSKFWINAGAVFAPFLIIFFGILITKWKEFWKNPKFRVIFILAAAPFIGSLFFVSNLGAIYDYYFTVYYLIWILLFCYVFGSVWKKLWGKIVVLSFIGFLLFQNGLTYKDTYFISAYDPTQTSFAGQISTIDWIYTDARGRDFNVDVYVPPVIPYEFDYLFKWYGVSKYGRPPVEKNISLLYTVYEIDPFHPQFLEAWLKRQEGIGKVIKEQSFGGITVQERERILYE